jgi:hypothetical protein
MKKKLLTATEFAVIKKLGVSTVYKYINEGKIQTETFTLGNRSQVLIPYSEIEKLKK